MKTRADVEQEYDVDADGIIRSPGKFECESWIAPIVYGWYLDGDVGEWVGNANVYVVSAQDHADLDLSESTFALWMDLSDQGFVYVSELDESEYNMIDRE